jgi:hypothetical protein
MTARWKALTHKWGDRLLARFDAWFTSGAGVWQTLFVCAAIVAVELIWPNLDPHWFWLLVFLTVYSAVTQPALAQAGASTIAKIEEFERRQAEEMAETAEILADVKKMLELLALDAKGQPHVD